MTKNNPLKNINEDVEVPQTFATDMGSLAFQNVYDYLEIYNGLKFTSSTATKDMPVAVRNKFDDIMDTILALADGIEDIITDWVASAIIQARSIDEAVYMDSLLDGQLSDIGIIDDAADRARKVVKLTSDKKKEERAMSELVELSEDLGLYD